MVPVEVSERLIESVPVVVDKVPPAAERVRREIVLARFLGKLAVDQGVRELRSRLSPVDRPEEPSGEPAVQPAAPERTVDVEPVDEPVAEQGSPSSDAPDADALALADYDHLSSAQVVSKLVGLDGPELDAIEAYERSGRHRRTILGKIEQLRSAETEQ